MDARGKDVGSGVGSGVVLSPYVHSILLSLKLIKEGSSRLKSIDHSIQHYPSRR